MCTTCTIFFTVPCGMRNSLVGKLLATHSRLSSLLYSKHTSIETHMTRRYQNCSLYDVLEDIWSRCQIRWLFSYLVPFSVSIRVLSSSQCVGRESESREKVAWSRAV